MLAFLLREDFFVHHQKGSHVQLRKNSFYVTIPSHSQKSLKLGTVLSILRQANIEKEYFLRNV